MASAMAQWSKVIAAKAMTPAWPTRRRPKRPTTRLLVQLASAIGAATAANTSPIHGSAS